MRRTWIEMPLLTLLQRGVVGRPPCGGRGLKLSPFGSDLSDQGVVLHAEDVD